MATLRSWGSRTFKTIEVMNDNEATQSFKEKALDFFYEPLAEGETKRKMKMGPLYAVLIGGFIGWLVITLTFGTKLKALLKKVPVVNMLFKPVRKSPRARAMRGRAPARRTYKKR